MKVAVAHDWLTGMRGGEQVLEAILDLFPEADVFTLICDRSKISSRIKSHSIQTSWMQWLPGVFKNYPKFLPIMPKAVRSLDVRGYDLIISSSHCVIKAVKKDRDTVHVSYVHAPMRYIWDRYEDYFGKDVASAATQWVGKTIRKSMQEWDRRWSQSDQVDRLIANSRFIKQKINEHYGRDAKVIHPFVNVKEFDFLPRDRRSGYYMIVSALVPYKRIDLAVQAFNELKLPLKVIGKGSELEKLEWKADHHIEFLGYQERETILSLMRDARAFVFPGKEDFGITPLESMACGVPVIAFGEGGALDTVVDGKTGIYFKPQTVSALKEAIIQMERSYREFEATQCRDHALTFTCHDFQKQFLNEIKMAFEEKGRMTEEIRARLSLFSSESVQSASSHLNESESEQDPNEANDSIQNPPQ